jgi:hypothetical protein
MLKNPEKYERDKLLVGKIHDHFSLSFPDSLLGMCAGYCQRALADESGMITTQKGNAQ